MSLEHWKTEDSARTLTRKFNAVVDELNTKDFTTESNYSTTEPSGLLIKDLDNATVDEVLKYNGLRGDE